MLTHHGLEINLKSFQMNYGSYVRISVSVSCVGALHYYQLAKYFYYYKNILGNISCHSFE